MTSREECLVDELAFPVLCLARDTSIVVAQSADHIRRCNAVAFFKNRYFDELIVFDSSGAQYRVVKATLAEPVTGVKRLLVRAFNGRLTVDLRLQREAAASLETAKDRVVAWIRKDPDFWEASRELSEWERMVKTAPDMRQLITLFS